jgi:hypothetical protein
VSPSPDTRSSIILPALTAEPASTSDVYERVGYIALMRAGLIGYAAFRHWLVALEAEGLVASETGDDGSTLWRRVSG